MAKKEVTEINTDTPETAEVPTSGGRGRKVILPTGEARVDYIQRRFFQEGATRGEITKELRELTGNANLAYQIVFAATKTKKDKAAEAPAEAEAEVANNDFE